MTDLPYIAAPRQHPPRRVGTLDSGILEIPVLGGITVEESTAISEILSKDPSAFVKGAKLADAIAAEEGISQSEAFVIIEKAISGDKLEDEANRIRLKHAERIEQIVRVYETAGQRNMEASVTAIIRHRLNLPTWTIDQTRKRHRSLLNDIWQLILDEQAAENLPENRPTEEELGKPPAGNGNGRKRIGSASSGGSATPTQAPSRETVSAAS